MLWDVTARSRIAAGVTGAAHAMSVMTPGKNEKAYARRAPGEFLWAGGSAKKQCSLHRDASRAE
jgi:hypothetical protein